MCDFDGYMEFGDDEFLEDGFEETCGGDLNESEVEELFEEAPEPYEEPVFGDEPSQDESGSDAFTGKDAFIIGGAIGWAYEEGLEERRRRKLLKNSKRKI